MYKCSISPICRQKQAAVGASRRDIRQVEQPWGRTTFPARALASLSDSSRQGEMMAMPASGFDFFFFKYISLLSHYFIDHRQNSLCPPATGTLGEDSFCNVITQMMMAREWPPPVSSIVFAESCGSTL